MVWGNHQCCVTAIGPRTPFYVFRPIVTLSLQGLIRAAGLSHASRPLAVLDGQLVVGTRGADSLTVIALPGGQLLGYVRLPGVSLYALAAPPSGGTLVVLDAREGSSDAESAALILPWPPASGFYASPSQSSSR